ncbi:TPA: hypothetical protein QDA90_003571 [Burkholderia vietnamiensis]|uniref:hypothetical protein n=1 Tax=Burkholderia vietnamiensis TaxID=60552 RepID=UPI00298BC0AD|nr:hypothetical protein [Burkholderia vietnamiensis]
MSEHDHFAANLDGPLVDEHPNVTGHPDADNADITTFDAEPKKKRSIPTPVLLAGGAALVMAAMFGYKHFKSKPDTQFTNAPVTSLPSDTGGMIPNSPASSPLPPQAGATDATQGGVTPLPAQAASPGIPTGPVPTVASGSMAADAASTKVNGLPLDMGTSSPTAGANATPFAAAASVVAAAATPASGAVSGVAGGIVIGASSVTTEAPAAAAPDATATDARDAEIRKLKRELKAARSALAHRGPHGSKAATVAQSDSRATDDADATTDAPVKKATTHARHTGKHKRRGVEVQLGYHIKQVIPGQGWVVDEESGKQIVVAVGDKIGASEVTRIDADNYKIYTTAGVIQ